MGINRYSKPVQQSLEQYVPAPFEEMLRAGSAIQQRGDLAQQKIDEVETGLASIEAYAPAQRDFVNTFASDFKSKASNLLTKYQGNTSDPMFIRESKKLSMQFANDPRLKVIKETNDKVKFNEQIAAKMQAEGKLYIKPEFTGADAKGNLISSVGNVQGVNTLDEWTKMGALAHQSTEEIGTTITNKNNLDRWKNSINGDTAGQAKLVKAFMQQGMNQQEAMNAVKTNVNGLINQYGIETKTNTGLLSLGLQERSLSQSASQFQQSRQDRINEAEAARKNALEIAKIKAAGKGAGQDGYGLPSVRSNDIGFSTSAPSTNKDVVNQSKQFVPTFGSSSMNSPTPIGSGLQNFGGTGFYRQTADKENVSYNGVLTKQRGAASIKNGQFEGLHNVAVDRQGNVITSRDKGEFVEKNGKTYYSYKGEDDKGNPKMLLREAKPMTMKVYTDKGTGSIYYAPANEQESMRYMGATGAYWEGRKTIAEQYNFKKGQTIPEPVRNIANSLDLNDPNTAATFNSILKSRGYDYDVDSFKDIFESIKTDPTATTGPTATKILDQVFTDLLNMSKYNQFNKPEFSNQGKRTNINNGLFKQSNDNTFTPADVSEAVDQYLEEQNQ